MDNEKYEQLANLLNELINAKGNWQEKQTELDRAMAEHNAESTLAELVSWYID